MKNPNINIKNILFSKMTILMLVTVTLTAFQPFYKIPSSAADKDNVILKKHIVPRNELVNTHVKNTSVHTAAYNVNNLQLKTSSDTSLPSEYDMRTTGQVTDIKDQDESGCCWAFATIKACESNAITKGLINMESADFSENHLAWFTYHGSTKTSDPLRVDGLYSNSSLNYDCYSKGAAVVMSAFTLARWSGTVYEKRAPFKASSYNDMSSMATAMKKNDKKLRYKSDFHMQNATCYDNADRNTIKTNLINNGAMTLALYYTKKYLSKKNQVSTYYQTSYTGETAIKSSNHAVTIIGWDDNFSRENFPASSRPASNGAWLCANSFGKSFGDEGYFWISYQEPSINEIYGYHVENTKNFNHNYQYDGFGWGSAFSGNKKEVKGANIFKVKGTHNQTLKAVGLYTLEDNQPYKIQIYTNVKNGKPASGKLITSATTKGTVEYNGFHTIPLKSNVNLKIGTSYSVVITYYPGKNITPYLPLEGRDITMSEHVLRYDGDLNQSFFYSAKNKRWIDTVKYGYNNICIKAFSTNKSGSQNIYAPKKIVVGKGEKFKLSIKLSGSKSKAIYKSSKKRIFKVSSKGKIHARHTGRATLTIKKGNISKKIKIYVKKRPEVVKVKHKKLKIKKGLRYKLNPYVPKGYGCYGFTYKSSKKSIVKVDSSGVIIAKKRGNAKITVKTYNNKKCKIRVKVT